MASKIESSNRRENLKELTMQELENSNFFKIVTECRKKNLINDQQERALYREKNQEQINLPVTRFNPQKMPNPFLFYAKKPCNIGKPRNKKSFCQNIIIDALPDLQMETLTNFNDRFGGLCEIVCNFVLVNDLLGSVNVPLQNNEIKLSKKLNSNYFVEKITPQGLNQPHIKKSHILDASSFFVKIIAFIFDIYPCSILSFYEQRQLLLKNELGEKFINPDVVRKRFDALDTDQYVKFEVFSKGFGFSGHSMLIKKTNDNEYSYFDPNTGEHSKLDFEALMPFLNDSYRKWGNCVAFIDAEAFLKQYVQTTFIAQHETLKPAI